MRAARLLDGLFEGYRGTVDLGSAPEGDYALNFGFEIEFVVEAPHGKKKTEASVRQWNREVFATVHRLCSFNLDGKCKLLRNYTAVKPDKRTWYIEPDVSVQAEDEGKVATGVEISSPVFTSVPSGMTSLKKSFQIMELLRKQGYLAYTNDTCGLHVSLGFNEKPPEFNVLKLCVLFGEAYVARLFGRQNCSFAMSVLQGFTERMQSDARPSSYLKTHPVPKTPEEVEKAFERYVVYVGHHNSINLDHYKSGKGYFEFRLAGGTDYERDVSKIEQTVRRYAQALQAASDPQSMRKEYLQKLSQLAGSVAPAPARTSRLQATVTQGVQASRTDLSSLSAPELKNEADALDRSIDYWAEYVKAGQPSGMTNFRVPTWKDFKEEFDRKNTRAQLYALRYYFNLKRLNPTRLNRIKKKLDAADKQAARPAKLKASATPAPPADSALRTQQDHRMAVRRLSALMDRNPGPFSAEGQQLANLASAIADYEHTHPQI